MTRTAMRSSVIGRRIGALVVSIVALATFAGVAKAQAPGADGVSIQARVVPLPNGLGELQIDLRDAATHQTLEMPPRRLAAWLQKPIASLADREIDCTDKVRLLATAGVGRRAAVDLNTYRLMTINTDASLSFINPFLRLNQAKLEDLVELPGVPTAVLHRPRQHEVWLTIANPALVVIVDTDTRKIRHRHSLPDEAHPVALTEQGGSVWVAQAGRDEWLRFDRAADRPEAIVAPRVQAWLAVPGAQAPLGLGVDGIVHSSGEVKTIGRVLHAAWSGLAMRGLAALAEGDLLWLDAHGDVQHRTAVPTVSRLAMFDGGRHAIAIVADEALILDLATTGIRQRIPLSAAVTDMVVTDAFVYLYSPGAAHATLLSIADLRRGQASAVPVAIGSDFRVEVPSLSAGSGARRLQPVPDGSGVYVASPQDGQIYQYAEGMLAPIGSFTNYKRSALALLLLDDALQSAGNGRYSATIRAPKAGNFELVLSGVQPRFAECRTIEVPELAVASLSDERRSAPIPRARLVAIEDQKAGGAVKVRARLETQQGEPLADPVNDLVLLAFDRRNGWQARRSMNPVGDGTYEAVLRVPPMTSIDLRVSSASRELPFHAGGLGVHATGRAP